MPGRSITEGTPAVEDDTGKWPTPWDVLDFAAAGLSIRDAWNDPSASNIGWAVADVAAAVAPGIPSAGLARHGAKLFAKTGDVAKAVSVGARRISGIYAGKRVENIGNFASGSLLKGHFQKHAGEFAGKFNNAREYARGAKTSSSGKVKSCFSTREGTVT